MSDDVKYSGWGPPSAPAAKKTPTNDDVKYSGWGPPQVPDKPPEKRRRGSEPPASIDTPTEGDQ